METINFCALEISHKKLVLLKHRKMMGEIDKSEWLHKIDIVIYAFIYYVTSQVTSKI